MGLSNLHSKITTVTCSEPKDSDHAGEEG